LKVKISESQKTILSLEVAVANRGAAAEEAVDAYTRLLSNLGLFPPLPPPFQNIDLQVELNTATSQPENLLKGPDVRQVIKPTLNATIEGKRSERAVVESERIKVDYELDQLISECENRLMTSGRSVFFCRSHRVVELMMHRFGRLRSGRLSRATPK